MKRAVLFIFVLCVLVMLCACSSRHSLSSLMRDVDSYHKDLLFDRYEYAAKRIAPASRLKWLEAVTAQGIHFSEIDVVSSDYCSSNQDDCVIVQTQIQWYSSGSPSIQTSNTETVWEFDEESKTWFIVEMK